MRKRLLQGMGAMLLGLLLWTLPVSAADQGAVTLTATGSGASAVLSWPEGTEKEIRSLQLGFQAEGAQQAELSFEFDAAIGSRIKEYRYQKDTGLLTLYISGSENLHTGDSLTLGEIKASVKEGSVTFSLRAVPDSLKLVNAASDMQSAELGTVNQVELTASGEAKPDGGGTGTTPDSGNGNGSGNDGSDSDGSGNSGSDSDGSGSNNSGSNGSGSGSSGSGSGSSGSQSSGSGTEAGKNNRNPVSVNKKNPAAVTEDPEKDASSEEKEEESKTDKEEADKEETEKEETDKAKTEKKEETASPLLKTLGIAAAALAVLAVAVVLVLRLRADKDSEE